MFSLILRSAFLFPQTWYLNSGLKFSGKNPLKPTASYFSFLFFRLTFRFEKLETKTGFEGKYRIFPVRAEGKWKYDIPCGTKSHLTVVSLSLRNIPFSTNIRSQRRFPPFLSPKIHPFGARETSVHPANL